MDVIDVAKAVLFDLGGVLITDIFPLMESYISGLAGVPYPKVREVRKRYWLDYELGRMDGVKFFTLQLDDLGVDLSPEELLVRSSSFIKVKQETLDVVRRLRASAKYSLGVISNNSDEWAAYSEDDLGLGKYFDAWVISSHHHIKKPDREIYALAAERLGLKTRDCLFIDNMQRNVDGAVAAGMQALRFTDAKQLEKDLKKRGIGF